MYMIHDEDNDTNYVWAILVILLEISGDYDKKLIHNYVHDS